MAASYSVLGDSISTFKGVVPPENRWYYDAGDTNGTGVASPDATWWMRVVGGAGGKFLANASFSGSMVQGCGFPAGRDAARARQLLGPNGEAPDVVLVFIGINDYGWGSPEAQAAGGSEAAPKCTLRDDVAGADPAGLASADAVARFEAAYAEMLDNVHAVAPDAEAWCLTLPPGRVSGEPGSTFCYRLRGADLQEYNDAIHRAAQRAGAKVADVAALGFDYDAIDGTHPTKEGMRQLAALALAAMNAAEGDDAGCEEALRDYPERLRSRRTCDEACCAGCPHASITEHRWTCVCAHQLVGA